MMEGRDKSMVDRHDTPKTFDDFYLSQELLHALSTIGYSTPTPVQAASIPLIMAGIDLIVQSQTGTGKTAAFGIPVIEMLEPDPGTIEVLVLAPTRELAKQVSDEFTRLTQFRPITSTSIYGGTAYGPQIEALKDAQIVCATPGRLLDLLQQKELSLDKLRFFILDEADEMLSMGFERDLRAILEHLPDDRQSLLFSATVTEDVRSLAGRMLFYPEFLSFSSDSVVNKNVTHSYYNVSGISRTRDLIRILEFEEPEHAIIFANTKDDTFLVNKFLQRHGYASEVLNGDMAQKEREKTLLKLRNNEINYLVATDVAARGIDITGLSHVFNYVLPDSPEVYVHRTGRTGRAGKKGIAISLVSPAEMTSFILTQKRVDMKITPRELPSTQEIIEAKQARRGQDILKTIELYDESRATQFEEIAAKLLEQQEDAASLVSKLLALASRTLTRRGKLKSIAAPAPAAAPTPEKSAPAAAPEAPVEAPKREEKRPRREEKERAQAPAPTKKVEETVEEVATEERDEATERRSSRKSPERESRRSSRDEDRRERGSKRRSSSRRDERSSSSSSASKAPARSEEPKKSEPVVIEHEMSKMWINFGKNVFKKNDDVLEFLVYNAGMDEEDFGDIRIERTHTFVDVRRDYLHDVISAINEIELEGSQVAAKPARR